MNEQELHKRFRKGLALCAVIGFLIVVIGITVLRIMDNSLRDIVHEQMKSETKDYQQRITRQIDRDYEALQSLAVFMDGYSTSDIEAFANRFYDAKATNSFVSMAYFNTDGKGVLVNSNEGIDIDADYHDFSKSVQIAIESSYKGNAEISSLFDSKLTDHQVFAYSVPVYSDDKSEVIGVLAATNHVEIFDELLESDKILSGNDAVHLVGSDGALLFSSTDPSNTLKLTSLLYSPYFFDEKTQAEIKHALENNETIFCTMSYNNHDYRVYLAPAGVNDWYLMCVNNPKGISYIAQRMVRALTITFASLLVIVLILLVYTMRANVTNTRNLITIAYKDPLTKADNMIRFTKNLSRERNSGKSFSIVALNIHQFKFINEVLGNKSADEILIFMYDCIIRLLRPDEFFCRESADSFYLFLRDTEEEDIRRRIDRIMNEISEKSDVGKKDYKIRLYAGVLIWKGESISEEKFPNELMITRTRFAMQYAKKLHNTNIHFYNEDIHKKEEMENYVETHMQKALETGEFKLYLQPKVDLSTVKLSGAEALVRWITADGKMIYPDMFIPQFEENGFCIQLDLYMFEQACKQIRAWMDAGITPIPISVNQSKLLFFDKDYISNLEAIIKKYNVPAKLITLEILESLVLGHVEELNKKLRKLRKIGFKISMDDFGSGYSSFNTLGSLDIDELKLDRGFLMEVSNEKDATGRYKTIMEHIINLSKSLNISTVAEGVETTENEELIQSLGCDYGQGYLYSRPISCDDFSNMYVESLKNN